MKRKSEKKSNREDLSWMDIDLLNDPQSYIAEADRARSAELKGNDLLFVGIPESVITYLESKGFKGTPIYGRVKRSDVEGKRVMGQLGIGLAAACESYTHVFVPAHKLGKTANELTQGDIKRLGVKIEGLEVKSLGYEWI